MVSDEWTESAHMAVASGPAGPVLARPVFTVIFGTVHAQIMNNEQYVWSHSGIDTREHTTDIAGTRTSPRPQQQAVSPIQRHKISLKRHISK